MFRRQISGIFKKARKNRRSTPTEGRGVRTAGAPALDLHPEPEPFGLRHLPESPSRLDCMKSSRSIRLRKGSLRRARPASHIRVPVRNRVTGQFRAYGRSRRCTRYMRGAGRLMASLPGFDVQGMAARASHPWIMGKMRKRRSNADRFCARCNGDRTDAFASDSISPGTGKRLPPRKRGRRP